MVVGCGKMSIDLQGGQLNMSVIQVKNAFQRIDVNGDGKLSKSEMLAGHEFNNEEVREHVKKI